MRSSLRQRLRRSPPDVVYTPIDVTSFQNATKVDRISVDDMKSCRVVSTYEVKLGDRVMVEVALARKEDSLSYVLTYKPVVTVIRDSLGNDVLGDSAAPSHFQLDLLRTINNAWNDASSGSYTVAVYRGKRSIGPEPLDTNVVVGDWVPNWGSLVPGTYRGGLVCLNSAARFDKWNRAAVR